MRRMKRGATALLLVGLLALMADRAAGSWWETFAEPKQVTLAKVLEDPSAFLGVPVEMTIQFHETTKFFNPFFTRFTPERYVNFAAWGDEAALWMPEDFAASHPLFFVNKGGPDAQKVLGLAPFTRLRVTALTLSTFKGQAWIEILKIKVERKALSRTSLGHIITGDKFAQQDRYNAAIQEYLKAWNADDLPGPARASVAGRLGRAYYETRQVQQARDYLSEAVRLDPEDTESKELLDRVIGRMAGELPNPPLPPLEEDEGGEAPTPAQPGETIHDTPETSPETEGQTTEDGETPTKRLSGPR
jgi:hypothetical protein